MVTNVVGEYDETTNTTTWDIETGVPGYRVPDANSIVLLGPNGIVERRNTLITVDATGRYVSTAGNFAGVPTAIGRSFRSSVTLSPLYFRAEQPIDDGRTQIAKVIVTHANTGAYRVSVSNRNGQPTRYTNYSSGSIDTTGIVHAVVGKASFDGAKLADNVKAFIEHIVSMQPASVRGQYVKSVAICGTMTPGVMVAV